MVGLLEDSILALQRMELAGPVYTMRIEEEMGLRPKINR